MKIKSYRTRTASEALQAIKKELGPDAVILSTKSVRQEGGVFGLFGRGMVEVTAAIDEPRLSSVPAESPEPAPRFNEALRAAAEVITRDDTVSLSQQARQQSLTSRSESDGMPGTPVSVPPKSTFEPDWRDLAKDLKALRELMEGTSRVRPAPRRSVSASKRLHLGLAGYYHDLVRVGVEPETAEALLLKTQSGLTREGLESDSAVRQTVHHTLASELTTSGPLLYPEEEKKTVIFVGPTGVGKTTTIAKLAAHYALNKKRSVALITLDTYRVAAVEQLRMYAKVIGVTLDVALTKQDALEFIRRRAKAELIFVDTAGRSPMDEAGIRDLRELVSLDHPLETHLVLSATTRDQDLIGGARGYAGIPITRLLVTKLDETRAYGGVFEVIRRSGLPLSYFSTGQNVPEDLEVAEPDRFAELLLGAALKRPPKRAFSDV